LKEFAAKEKLEIVKEHGEPACGRAANYGGLLSPPAAKNVRTILSIGSLEFPQDFSLEQLYVVVCVA